MTSRTGNSGFTMIEVLVASVILFVGLGAVLKAYSLAVSALDATSDLLASSTLFRERMAVTGLQAGEGGGAFAVTGGKTRFNGVEYGWTVNVNSKAVAADLDIQSEVIRVARLRGGQARTLECEWPVFHEHETQ